MTICATSAQQKNSFISEHKEVSRGLSEIAWLVTDVARRESVSKGANGGICPRFCDLKSFYFFETFVLRFRKPCIGLLFFWACVKI